MVSTPRKTKKKTAGATSERVDASARATLEPQLTRLERTRDFTRSALHKGAHDSLAALVKGGILWVVLLVPPGLYFGCSFDPSVWVNGKPRATSSTDRATKVPDWETVDRLVNCRLKRQREIERLVDRRKYAWGLLDKCKADWKPPADQKQTADEACTQHLTRYRAISQEVKAREAKDDCATTPP